MRAGWETCNGFVGGVVVKVTGLGVGANMEVGEGEGVNSTLVSIGAATTQHLMVHASCL